MYTTGTSVAMRTVRFMRAVNLQLKGRVTLSAGLCSQDGCREAHEDGFMTSREMRWSVLVRMMLRYRG